MAGYIGSKAVNLSTTGADINGDANIDGDLSFRDNDKIKLGAGSDLQIYHDGSNSYIDETGTGTLRIRGYNQVRITDTSDNIAAIFKGDAETTLYHNDSPKLATESGGVNITGTLSSDGLTVDGDILLNGDRDLHLVASNPNAGTSFQYGEITLGDAASGQYVNHAKIISNGNYANQTSLEFHTSNNNSSPLRMEINEIGDISFYEDTGTTAKFFWDASAESLGIGTSSPATGGIHIAGDYASNKSDITLQNTNGGRTYRIGDGVGGHVGKLTFFDGTASAARMVIDSSGNVGIGQSAPVYQLHLANSTDDDGIFIGNTSNTENKRIVFGNSAEAGKAAIATFNEATFGRKSLDFFINSVADNSTDIDYTSTPQMRITNDGKFLVGKASDNNTDVGLAVNSNGYTKIVRSSGTANVNSVLQLNRLTTDGDIAVFQKDGSTVASIGVSGVITYWKNYQASSDTGVGIAGAGQFVAVNSTGAGLDNSRDLGAASIRWDDVHATNGTIQTSDRNEKQDIEELTDAEQRVAVAAKGLLRKFRWRDAVEAKGDEARTHFGIIAQDLQAAFAAEGLDAGDYAMFISSTWTDEDSGEERTRMGVRYSELLAFIIGAL